MIIFTDFQKGSWSTPLAGQLRAVLAGLVRAAAFPLFCKTADRSSAVEVSCERSYRMVNIMSFSHNFILKFVMLVN